MLMFTVINLLGAKLLSDSNTAMVIWKVAVPILAVIVIMSLSFHGSNFTAGGGFAPYGAHGVFAALPAGVVFALQGFEQAVQMGGEARDPKKDISRAIISSMFIGAAIYIALEVAFIGGISPANVAHNWNNPIGAGDFGPYYTLALAAGAGWLGTIPFGRRRGLTWRHWAGLPRNVGPALVRAGRGRGADRQADPDEQAWRAGLVDHSRLRNWRDCVSSVPSWASLVGLVTGATAIMYAFAPVALAALQARDPDRPRPYRAPSRSS